MEIRLNPRKNTHRRRGLVWFILIIVLALLLSGSWVYYQHWLESLPSTERVELDFDGNPKPIFLDGNQLDTPASGTGEELMLPLDVVQQYIDSNAYYEEETESFIITTTDKVIRFQTEQLTVWVNEKPFALQLPVQKIGEIIYIPIDILQPYYQFELREDVTTGAVFLLQNGDILQKGIVKVDVDQSELVVHLRTEASIKAPIAADLNEGDSVMILSEQSDWYQIQLENGWKGFIQEQNLVLSGVEVIHYEPESQTTNIPWKPLGGKINLTWEAVYNKNPDTKSFIDMPGLNVISPTWFAIDDDNGNLSNKANKSFVTWAHGKGYQVWALFSNDTDPDRTSKVLANYETRLHIIRQLLSYAALYNLQGINIDFENVYLKDKDKLTQFVRELTPYLHEQNLVVSIDVAIRGGSEMWSLFADREALGQTVDYMMVMTYDEYWASSPVAGSVASLPWTEAGIVDIMREDKVPANKLILGVPYYTRIWSEKFIDNKQKIASKAVSMEVIDKLIKEKKLTPEFDEATGQDYVEYTEDKVLNKIWIENEKSMRARMDIVKKYNLAGVASWARVFGNAEIWEAIKDTLEKKP
ncbi:MAG: glycosyl hydrolase family 18 protein [Paenibacillaceae bacterium]